MLKQSIWAPSADLRSLLWLSFWKAPQAAGRDDQIREVGGFRRSGLGLGGPGDPGSGFCGEDFKHAEAEFTLKHLEHSFVQRPNVEKTNFEKTAQTLDDRNKPGFLSVLQADLYQNLSE